MKHPETGAAYATPFLIILLLAAALLPYLNTFNNDFVGYDDQNLIQNNRQIRSLAPKNVARIFVPRLRGAYQPIRTLSYALDYAIWGPRPFGFHLTNILLHAATVVGVWLLLRHLMPEPVPWLAALFFAVHPIHVESVTWMSARKDVLSLALFLLAILCYERSEKRRSVSLYLGSILATALALLSKLTTVSLAPCILLLEICREGWPKSGELSRKLFRLAPHLLLTCVVVALNFVSFGSTSSHGDPLAGMERASTTFLHDVRLSMLLVVCRYIGLLFLPFNLSTHYDVARISRIADARALLPIAFLAILIAFGLLCFLHKRRAAAFCVGWFIITFLPTSNIVPSTSMMNDRYMHIPSIGFVALLAMALAYPATRIPKGRGGAARFTAIMPIAIVTLLFSILTIRRNADWRDTVTLFTRTLLVNPRSVDTRIALGAMYDEAGDYDSAIRMYLEALETQPHHYRVLFNLSVSYKKKGWRRQAIEALEKSRAANPDFLATRLNLALAYHEQKLYEQAITEHREVLRIAPGNAASHGDLGRIYLETGQLDLALAELNEALRIKPDLIPSLIDRAKLLMKGARYGEAEQDLQKLESLGVDTRDLRAKMPRS